MTNQMYMNTATGSVDNYDGWWYENESGEQVNAVDLGEVVKVEPTPVVNANDDEGYVNAYMIEEGGALRLTEMTLDADGLLLDSDLQPIIIDGPVHELMGWPDSYAVQVSSSLMIAVEWEVA